MSDIEQELEKHLHSGMSKLGTTGMAYTELRELATKALATIKVQRAEIERLQNIVLNSQNNKDMERMVKLQNDMDLEEEKTKMGDRHE